MQWETKIMRQITSLPTSRLLAGRGARSMTSGSAGSAASAMPRVVEVTMLTRRIWGWGGGGGGGFEIEQKKQSDGVA